MDQPVSKRAASSSSSGLPLVVYEAEGGAWSRARDAARDFVQSLRRSQLWFNLAGHDIAARYRGSLLGPWWITISMAVLIAGMSVLYSELLQLALPDYVPWLSAGIVLWGLINSTIHEGCESFTGAAALLRQSPLPLSMFVLRTMARNTMVFAHNMLIVLVVAILFDRWDDVRPLEFGAALLLLWLNLGWIVTFVGLASARFRDVPQIVGAILQVSLFLTPVFWRADQLPRPPILLAFNPFLHLLEIVRAPVVGAPADPASWMFCGGLALAGWLGVFPLFAYLRRRLVHYL